METDIAKKTNADEAKKIQETNEYKALWLELNIRYQLIKDCTTAIDSQKFPKPKTGKASSSRCFH